MKKSLILLLAIVISACCSTKPVTKNVPKKERATVITSKNDTVNTTKTPKTIEVTAPEPTPIIVAKTPPVIKTETIIEDNLPQTTETLTETPRIETTEAFNHSAWNQLLQKHVSQAGNVNYSAFKNNKKALRDYISSLSENMPNTTWNTEDKLAYWINAYNAMTVDLIIRNLPLKSIKDIDKPWEQRLWKLGKKWYNLDSIEHQILRKMNEPRIHFGIVCASFSCPKLQNEAFTARQLENQLTSATTEFLSDTKRNNITKNSIKLSKIFKWFAKDFKQNGSLINFINQYSNTTVSANAKKSFKDYNWDLND